MAKLIGGACTLYIEGTLYSSVGEFTGTVNNVTREEVLDSSGNVYFTESPVVSTVSGDILLTETMKASTIINMVEGTVQVQLRSGKTILLSNAFFSGDASVDAKEGKLSVEFKGVGKLV